MMNDSLRLWITRRPSDVYLRPFPKTNWLFSSFAYSAGHEWSLLPLSIREASNITFKSELKQQFMANGYGLNVIVIYIYSNSAYDNYTTFNFSVQFCYLSGPPFTCTILVLKGQP